MKSIVKAFAFAILAIVLTHNVNAQETEQPWLEQEFIASGEIMDKWYGTEGTVHSIWTIDPVTNEVMHLIAVDSSDVKQINLLRVCPEGNTRIATYINTKSDVYALRCDRDMDTLSMSEIDQELAIMHDIGTRENVDLSTAILMDFALVQFN